MATDLEVENILRYSSKNYDEKNSDMLRSINSIEKAMNTYVYYGDFINSICIYAEKSNYKVVSSNLDYANWKYSDTLEKEFKQNKVRPIGPQCFLRRIPYPSLGQFLYTPARKKE
jgi:two-component system sensor histidine kinase YesM